MKFSFIEQSGETVLVELDSPNFLCIELIIKFDDLNTFHVCVNGTEYILHHTYTLERTRDLFEKLARMMDKLAKAKDQKTYVLIINSKEDIREILTFHEVRIPTWSK